MPELSWIGSYARFRAFRFDKGWPTIELFRGDDTTIHFAAQSPSPTVTYADANYAITPVDLTNVRPIFILSDPETGGAVHIRKDLSNGITLTDAVNGKMDILISSIDTLNLPIGVYSCAVAIKDNATNHVATLARSSVFLYRSLTENVSW